MKHAVTPTRDLFEFFLERVQHAAERQGRPVTEQAIFYLSHVLAENGDPEEIPESTLAELRARAATAPRAEAVTLWKRVGDHSLMVTGYFREQLERRHVSRAYCAAMGSAAYGVLAASLAGPAGGHELYAELAARWDRCADVIAEVRDETLERRDTDLVKLYEEWLATGSPRVAERLRQLGLVPTRTRGIG